MRVHVSSYSWHSIASAGSYVLLFSHSRPSPDLAPMRQLPALLLLIQSPVFPSSRTPHHRSARSTHTFYVSHWPALTAGQKVWRIRNTERDPPKLVRLQSSFLRSKYSPLCRVTGKKSRTLYMTRERTGRISGALSRSITFGMLFEPGVGLARMGCRIPAVRDTLWRTSFQSTAGTQQLSSHRAVASTRTSPSLFTLTYPSSLRASMLGSSCERGRRYYWNLRGSMSLVPILSNVHQNG